MDNSVYHYTSLDAFTKIIKGEKLWFTHIDCLNDTSEYSHYDIVLEKAIDEVKKETIINTNELENRLDIIHKFKKLFHPDIYTFSFSNNGNSIPMWNYYSEVSGISLGFNKILLTKMMSEYYIRKAIAFSGNDIIYDEDKQIVMFKENIYKTINESKNLEFDFHIIKKDCFKYEDEYRFALLSKNKESDINIIATKTDLKKICIVELPEGWKKTITEIYISPYNKSENLKQKIIEFLEFNKIKIDHERIIKSELPVRQK